MMAGPSEDRMAVFPARVLNMPEGSVFIFTMFQIPGITAEKFEEQYRSFLIEAENLRRIFA